MKVRLMDPDRDLDPEASPPWNADDLTRDLQLDVVFRTMAAGDEAVDAVARQVLVGAVANPIPVIRYRQAVLADALRHPELVREMYRLATDALEADRGGRFGLGASLPGVVLRSAVGLLTGFTDRLARLRGIADRQGAAFESEGFRRLLAMLQDVLTDDYLTTIRAHLGELGFRHGVLMSARLGQGNKGVGYTLRRLPDRDRSRLKRWMTAGPTRYRHEIPDDDGKGKRALADLRDEQLGPVADAMRQTALDVRGFFERLHAELAFYVGALNLRDRLAERGLATAWPDPRPPEDRRARVDGLYDLALALTSRERVVSNDLRADNRGTVVVTGANQGGKSTFLRSVGQCQLMMQAGLFVPATEAVVSVSDGVVTHFRREEDATLRSGKLDEELGRLSRIVGAMTPQSVFLSNESCAVTNQREGSEILLEVARALRDHGVRAYYVTHMYEFAAAVDALEAADTLLLRAEREAGGRRTFRIREGPPRDTSHGEDLYYQIFDDHGPAKEAGER